MVNGRESIWALADRRLTYPNQQPRDNARKLMFLDTKDGVAILGYAGLGATVRGTEPADWIGAVLRGRNLPLEQCLGALADALRRQLPKHLRTLPAGAPAGHNIIVSAFVDEQVRLYTIDLVLAPDRRHFAFHYTRHVVHSPPGLPQRTPRLGLAGSGAAFLVRDKAWIRNLLRLVRASDAKKVSPSRIADELASINQVAAANTRDGSVGPSCIVAWRHRKSGVHKGGGAHQFYEGTRRTSDSSALPTIANGMDIQALIKAMQPHIFRQMEALRTGAPSPELNVTELNAELAKIPERPDETLK